ncbi:integral membrane protein protein [Babesia ovis]|uniref:Integral membrane protein protein n=1 Tax=Babesia ovis TaxID=5869 RepID=A0A9W5TBP8_BABOV|nr:integral membrane protein protein [Babesia ovis]
MVANSRSSLMFLQSDYSRCASPVQGAQDAWEQEFERKRQRLQKRCKELSATFCPNSGQSPQGRAYQSAQRDHIHNSAAEEGPQGDPQSVVDETPQGVDSGGNRKYTSHTQTSYPVVPNCGRSEGHRHSTTCSQVKDDSGVAHDRHRLCLADLLSETRSPCQFTEHLNRGVPSDICIDRRYSDSSLTPHLASAVPLRLLLHCQGGIGTSTPSCDRSFVLLDPPVLPQPNCGAYPQYSSPNRTTLPHHATRRYSRDISTVGNYANYRDSHRHPRLPCDTHHRVRTGHRNTRLRGDSCCPPSHNGHCRYSNPASKIFYNRVGDTCKGIGRYQDQKIYPSGGNWYAPHNRSDKLRKSNRAHIQHKNRCYKMDGNTPTHAERVDPSFSVEDGDSLTPCGREEMTPGNSQDAPRTVAPLAKIDANYIDRLLSGHTVSLDVLKAPEFGSSETARYVISICREVFMGAIGAQLVYVVTSMMFGNIAAAIIVSLLCVQSAVCHCDGRPVAYVINGVLSMLVGTTVTVALCRDVAGLEPYRQDPVLNTMSYIYVPLCFLFGIFSFYLAHSNYDLQKQERRAIVQAVNRLLGERYRINERNLCVERSS